MRHPAAQSRGQQHRSEIVRFTINNSPEPQRLGEGYSLRLLYAEAFACNDGLLHVLAEAYIPHTVGRLRPEHTGAKVCVVSEGDQVPKGGHFIAPVLGSASHQCLYEVPR